MTTSFFTLTVKVPKKGMYRICYRTDDVSAYTCDSFFCDPIVCPCKYTISIETNGCQSLQINGYVQPECEPVESVVNRTPFITDVVTASSGCKKWKVSYSNLDFTGVLLYLANVGFGYITPPTITFVGGGGTGMTGVTTTNGLGQVITATIVNPGTGYTNYPDIVLSPPPLGGTRAQVTFISAYGYTVPSNCFLDDSVEFGQLFNMLPNYYVCSQNLPAVAPNLFATEEGVCGCGCITVTITPATDYWEHRYIYYDCLGNLQSGKPLTNEPYTLCIVPGTLVIDLFFLCDGVSPCPSTPPTVIYGTPCS